MWGLLQKEMVRTRDLSISCAAFLVLGCRGTPVTVAHPPVEAAAAASAESPAAVNTAASACPPGAAGVLVRASDVDLVCRDGLASCSARIPVSVSNCTARPIELRVLRVHREGDDDPGPEITIEPQSPHLAPGGIFVHELPIWGAGEYALVAEGNAGPLASGRVTVTNSTRAAAMTACTACRGEWGRRGLAGVEGCNCRTSDVGQSCDDGEDCEGACLFQRFDVVQPAKPLTCRDGKCSVTLALGRAVGACSEWRSNFGCKHRITRGASREPPVPLPGRAPLVCVD
jgi:hypothetical protein